MQESLEFDDLMMSRVREGKGTRTSARFGGWKLDERRLPWEREDGK